MVTEAGGIFVGYIGPCVDIDDVKTTQLEDLAKQKLETIGALAGGIAHDFNKLLGSRHDSGSPTQDSRQVLYNQSLRHPRPGTLRCKANRAKPPRGRPA